jgi:hypothetical protein
MTSHNFPALEIEKMSDVVRRALLGTKQGKKILG